MHSRRIAKASEAVREVVSSTILFQLRDPRIQHVTVLHAEVAPDMRTAKVYVSVMGDPKQQSLTMHGLESARGFIQSKIAERLDTRYTPVLKFVLDQGVKRSIEVSRVLREANESDAHSDPADEEAADHSAQAAEMSIEDVARSSGADQPD